MRSVSICSLILSFLFIYNLEASFPLANSNSIASKLLYKTLETPKVRLEKSFANADALFNKRTYDKSLVSIKNCEKFYEILTQWEKYTNTVVTHILESIRIKLDSHGKLIDTFSILADIENYFIIHEVQNPLYAKILDFDALHKNAEQNFLCCTLMPLSLTEKEADVLNCIAEYEKTNIKLFNTIRYICNLLSEQQDSKQKAM